MKYKVIVNFSSAKAYDVEADTEEEASDKGYKLALDEEFALTFDDIQVIDIL